MSIFTDQKARAAFIYGMEMQPCPACGSYDMGPQLPIADQPDPAASPAEVVRHLARTLRSGQTPLLGPAYYACRACWHKGPSVNCTGRTSEECRADAGLNAEMKRLWNTQGKPQ